jgi:Hypothetical glycosyl hydrolase family 15
MSVALLPTRLPWRGRPRGRACRLLAVSLALALASSGATAATPWSRDAAAVSGRFLKTFAAANERPTARTREQAVADAKRFDVISATVGMYTPHASAMRTANPGLVLLAYLNGTFAQKSEGTKYPESWYARDRYGRKVTSKGYGNYLMNPTNPAWISERTERCRQLLAQSGYGGCILDMLGTAPTDPGYVSSPAINPATGSPWTAADWVRATTALAGKVDAGTTGQLWGNGYGNGTRYFSAQLGGTKVLGNGVQGALSEVWLRSAAQSITWFPDESRWKDSVNQLVDLGRTGERTAAMVKLWTSGTTAQKDAYHRFALASFLLGSDGRSSFQASYASGDALAGHRYWTTDIGTPTGAYASAGGVYQRTFTRGKVLVNPTTTTRTVALGAAYVDLSGVRRTSVTLAPHTGDVFRVP